ncbi:MAG TPA: hypothetical protein VGR95_05700 [Thermoanaerobaculia bacterium]|nr:hypothetical protein [Thermoanaerobaculia bacterium]
MARIHHLMTSTLVVVLLVMACGCHKPVAPDSAATNSDTPSLGSSPTPDNAATLKGEIADVRSQVTAAENESSRYSGGLVKALIDSRVQILRQTLAMLEQRDKAFTFGLRLRYTVDGKPFQLPKDAKDELPGIDRELRDNEAKIRRQELEVSQYSGGLVQALGLSTLATMKQTHAMLDQRRLAIEYELPQYLPFQTSHPNEAADEPAPTTSVPPSQAPSRSDDWGIVEVASRPGESNSTWTRFSWKLTIRNKSSVAQKFDATIEFRDSEGFPVDSDNDHNLIVPAFGEETFTGAKLIDASQVGRISSTAAKVNKRP